MAATVASGIDAVEVVEVWADEGDGERDLSLWHAKITLPEVARIRQIHNEAKTIIAD